MKSSDADETSACEHTDLDRRLLAGSDAPLIFSVAHGAADGTRWVIPPSFALPVATLEGVTYYMRVLQPLDGATLAPHGETR